MEGQGMTGYSELVKALRSASTVSTAWEKLMRDAAAAIEDMAKHITEMHERVTVLQIARGELEAEVEELKAKKMKLAENSLRFVGEVRELDKRRLEPKRGKWIGVSPMVDTVQCSVCGGQLFSAELETPYCPYCGAEMEVQDG